jgi:hypothetical protein
MRSRSASATALRMVNTSLEMPLPVTSPPRSIVCRLTPLLLQPFEYAERVQGFVPPPAGALPTELLYVFGSFLSHGFVRHESTAKPYSPGTGHFRRPIGTSSCSRLFQTHPRQMPTELQPR